MPTARRGNETSLDRRSTTGMLLAVCHCAQPAASKDSKTRGRSPCPPSCLLANHCLGSFDGWGFKDCWVSTGWLLGFDRMIVAVWSVDCWGWIRWLLRLDKMIAEGKVLNLYLWFGWLLLCFEKPSFSYLVNIFLCKKFIKIGTYGNLLK